MHKDILAIYVAYIHVGEETTRSLALFIYEHPYIPIIGHTHMQWPHALWQYWQ